MSAGHDGCGRRLRRNPAAPASHLHGRKNPVRLDGWAAARRRLPTHGELAWALTFDQIQLAPGGELTSEVYPSGSSTGSVDVLYITDEAGSVSVVPNTAGGEKAFRCVADPLN